MLFLNKMTSLLFKIDDCIEMLERLEDAEDLGKKFIANKVYW